MMLSSVTMTFMICNLTLLPSYISLDLALSMSVYLT